MASFAELVDEQRQTGERIETIIRNYKKDSPSRKESVDYLQERLRRLTEQWSIFETNDNKIRSLENLPMDHRYFTEDYYTSLLKVVEQYRNILENSILQVKANTITATNPQQKLQQQANCTEKLPLETGQLVKLIRRQAAMMASLERLLGDEFSNADTTIATKLWQNIEDMHYQIAESCDEPTSQGYNDARFLQLETRCRRALQAANIRAPSQHNSPQTMTMPESSTMPIPKITLPRFDGSYLKWTEFHDLFSSLIIMQPLAPVQKMWYLKTHLTGEAANLIKHFTATGENFEAAWATVQDRYNNKRLLVNKLVQELVDAPKKTASDHYKSLHDKTKECLLSLQNLHINTSSWDPLLLPILLKGLDQDTRLRYEQSLAQPREVPTIHDFLKFLEMHFQSREAMNQKEKSSSKVCASASSSRLLADRCALCKMSSHQLYQCERFKQLQPHERLNFVQKQRLCVNCLRTGHASKQCPSRSCLKCNKKHNSLLHLENNKYSSTSSSNTAIKAKTAVIPETPLYPTKTGTASLAAANKQSSPSLVILGTAVVKIKTDSSEIECRALLDSGSQINCISDGLVKRLGIPKQPTSANINGIGSTKTKIQHRVNVMLHSRINGFATQFEAFVLPRIISPQPAQFIEVSEWKVPKNLVLADPNFNRPGKIDLLLGAEHFLQLLSVGQIKLSPQLPIIQNTLLGWVISGKIHEKESTNFSCGVFTTNETLEASIAKLWELDEIKSSKKPLSVAERRCEEIFAQSTTRDNKNRFIVKIPFHQKPQILGESYKIALNRFLSLENRLQKNPSLREQYTKFMDEYEDMEHMTMISPDSIPSPHYFIPHHCVLRPDSTTTKLRVVFDASAKTTSGHSLNDLMYVGPTVQSELFSILLRFRIPRFVFSTDVEKMYRQVLIDPKDRQFQLIIWRKDASKPLTYYQLNTVTYGTRAAPYLATKCLQQLAKENATHYPLAAQFLQENFYVDDGLGGSDNLNTAIHLQEQLQQIMRQSNFNLRKWCANHPQLLKNVPQGDIEVNLDFEGTKSNSISTLGLTWLPKEDQLCVKVNVSDSKRVTKRTVTSDLARIFDPLGLLSPIVVTAKIFIQELWKLKFDWDQALPESMHTKWISFRKELDELKQLKISRHIFNGEKAGAVQLHIFSDASEKAYGAAAYLRSVMKNGTVLTRLLCAKSRIAPLKTQTIPRLELCAAVLGAQLATRIKTDLQLTTQVWCWTDSEIVLSWINSPASLNTFVANRISTILENTQAEQWRHVSTTCNPADILSRGIAPRHLKNCCLWFYGPPFLHGKEIVWPPTFNSNLAIPTNLERKERQVLVTTTTEPDLIYQINHGNSFRRLQHIIGYILRFINNIKGKRDVRQPHKSLTTIELNKALTIILKQMQASEFSAETQHLTKYKELRGSSNLSNLSPFLDAEGLIRVGGRLEASPLDYDSKHQWLIPYNDPIAKLLFEMIHKDNKHCGTQTLLGIVRQRFWPIKGKVMARATIHRCTTCSKAKPALFHQIMGNLPSARVTPARPFVNSGVDYCGPITVHYKVRGKRPHKAYIAIFCCFSTKAVHLELVSDLTTDAFIGAIKRFTGRRGHCQNLYCDNATNFVGTRNKLAELVSAIYTDEGKEAIKNACSKKGIQFNFIPPRAPHFGGLWEAAVKSAKHLLIRSLANASLTYEELETLIIEIEAILNSRPISPLSNDPNDIGALTPGHFLIGEPLTAQIDAVAKPTTASLATRWKLVSMLKHNFWGRWSRDYLNELQYRHKWKEHSKHLTPGTIVILKEDNTPVMKWPLGRVIKVYKGEDDVVRVADVKTASGILKRAVHYLAPLPRSQVEEEEDHDGGEEVPEPKHKRLKIQGTNLCMSLLTLLLIFPMILGMQFENKQFGSKLGIHFEELGSTYISNNQWKLIVYYDLAAYWTDMTALGNGMISLSRLCEKLENNVTCFSTIEHLTHIETDLRVDNKLLYKARPKRGALDIVGNVAHSLFGVLDSEYAEKMSTTITTLKENDEYMLHLIKDHTSVINSTLNIVKENLAASKFKFDHLLTKLNEITKASDVLAHEINQLKIEQLFSIGVTKLSFIANNLQRMQTSIVDTLTDTHHGKINPLLLTPTQLETEIQKIKAHLPPSLELPVLEEDLLEFYKIMKIKGGITQEHVVFSITLPLIDQEKFRLYHLLPVPIATNNTMITIDPCSLTIAINSTLRHYFPLSSEQLKDCDLIRQNVSICYDVQLQYNFGAEMCSCEINLFNNVTIPHCMLRTLPNNVIWIPSAQKNKWIYSSLSATEATAVCGKDITTIKLLGSGLLTINANCILKHDLIYMSGQQSITTTATSSYTSLGNISELAHQRIAIINQHNTTNQSTWPDEITVQLSKLETLHKKLESVDASNFKPHQSSKHNMTIAYSALFLSAIALILIVVRIARRRKSKTVHITERQQLSTCNLPALETEPTPTPSPRQTFTIQV